MITIPLLKIKGRYISTQFQSIGRKTTNFILLTYFLFTVGCIIWGMDRGFDISDEGIYMLGFSPLQEKFDFFMPFFTIISKSFSWLNPTVITYRWCMFFWVISSSCLFAFAFWSYLVKSYEQGDLFFNGKSIFYVIAISNFFSCYGTYPQNLSYNIATNTIMLVMSSLFFLALSYQQAFKENQKLFKLAWSAAGFLIAVEYFIKPTSAITFLCFFIFSSFLCWRKREQRQLFYISLWYLSLGVVAGPLVYFSLFQNISIYLERLPTQANVLLNSSSFHNPKVLAVRYYRELIALLKFLAPLSVVCLLIFMLVISQLSNYRASFKKLLFVIVSLICSGLVFVYCLFVRPDVFGLFVREQPRAFFLIGFLLLLFTVYAASCYAHRHPHGLIQKKRPQLVIVGLLLFLLPFGAGVGNSLWVIGQTIIHITPWMGLIMLLLLGINREERLRCFIWPFILILVSWLQIKFLQGYVSEPYHLPKGLLYQTESISPSVPNAKLLKVDSETKALYEGLSQLLKEAKFKPGDPILGLFDIAGLVYIVGGISPGSPLFMPYREEFQLNCSYLTQSKVDKTKLILLVNSTIDADFINCMKQNNILFPENYIAIGKVSNPYDYRPGMDFVVVYAPKSSSI